MSYTSKVLIVDDEPRMRDSVKALLNDQGYEIRTCNNGKEAIEYLLGNGFDLVLLDIVMPEMDGLQVMHYIDSHDTETLVIVMTGHASIESAVEALRSGAYDYLRKPFGHEELLKTVRNAVDQKRLKRERDRAVEVLKEYSERLEEMVEQRTKDLQEAQEQLVRREKLAVLGQLAGGVSHELRNPLGAIINAAYFLNMAIKDPEPEVKEALEILEKEVKTSEGIISSLLDYARPKPATRLKVDVNDIVQEALSRCPVPENIEVVSRLNETLPIISADPDQLNQVFGNLIWNAIQAMPEGGRLVVKASASYIRPVFDPECSDRRELMSKAVEPSEAPSPERVAISFTDTGAGIDEETLGKVFEPLFTTKATGIGLGLAFAKMLIEAHGGTIEGESEMGKGSTFTVKLPVKD